MMKRLITLTTLLLTLVCVCCHVILARKSVKSSSRRLDRILTKSTTPSFITTTPMDELIDYDDETDQPVLADVIKMATATAGASSLPSNGFREVYVSSTSTSRPTRILPSTITQVSLYSGLTLFTVVVVVICLVATLVAAPDDDRPPRRRCCCCRRPLRHDHGVSQTNACLTSSQTFSERAGNRNTISSRGSLVHQPPPSYDEVVSVTGSEQNLVSAVVVEYPDVAFGTHLSGSSVSVSDCDNCNCVTPSMADDEPVQQAAVNTRCDVEGELSGRSLTSATSSGAFLASAGRRLLDCITPPNYFQVIRDLAARGILINRKQLSPAPPAYYELERHHNRYSMMSTSASHHHCTTASPSTVGSLQVIPSAKSSSSPSSRDVALDNSSARVILSPSVLTVNEIGVC